MESPSSHKLVERSRGQSVLIWIVTCSSRPNRVNINLTWSLQSSDYTLSPAKDLSKESSFVDGRLTENDAFAIFDQTNRYGIDLPNAWNDWPDVKKIRNEQKP
jgi:hypothetical protein